MSQYLPHGNFKWVNNVNEIEQKLMKIKNNSSTGYMLQVDLKYPKELEHSNYPLAPEKINIQKECLSDYCLKIVYEHNIKIRSTKN